MPAANALVLKFHIPLRLAMASLITISASACQTSGSKVKDAAIALAPACAAGESAMLFRLAPVDFIVAPTDLPIAGIEQVQQPSPDFNMLLDTCFNDTSETATLKKVTFTQGPGYASNELFPDAASTVQNLSGALFGSSLATFKISLPIFQTLKLVVRGVEGANGGSYVFFAMAQEAADGSLTAGENWAVAGKLEVGNPFDEGPCPSGFSQRKSHMSAGPMTFEMEGCVAGGDVGGVGYSFTKIRVKNSTPGLAATDADFTLEKAQIDSSVTTIKKHHNVCDRLDINLPSQHIAVTSLGQPGTTCPVLGFAPEISAAEASTMGTKVKIQFNKTGDAIFHAPCFHFLLACGSSPL